MYFNYYLHVLLPVVSTVEMIDDIQIGIEQAMTAIPDNIEPIALAVERLAYPYMRQLLQHYSLTIQFAQAVLLFACAMLQFVAVVYGFY